MTDPQFAKECEEIFNRIRNNRPILECLNKINALVATATAPSPVSVFEPLWFIYYMFFAIHNPKMEDYIQTKTNTPQGAANIIKNMIKRRNHTSSIVYMLYTYAYTNNGSPTYVYPKDKDNLSKQIVKSYQSNHLKTTAVHIRRAATSSASASAAAGAVVIDTNVYRDVIEYIQSTSTSASTSASTSTSTSALLPEYKSNPEPILERINKIKYHRKDIIFLALLCYMKIDEEDINQKNIFIAVSNDELQCDPSSQSPPPPTTPPPPPPSSPTQSDSYTKKYEYLYT